MFRMGSNAALHGKPVGRRGANLATGLCKSGLVQREKSLDQFHAPFLELFQDGPHEHALGGEGMTATIQPGFKPPLRNPDSLFGQKPTLN